MCYHIDWYDKPHHATTRQLEHRQSYELDPATHNRIPVFDKHSIEGAAIRSTPATTHDILRFSIDIVVLAKNHNIWQMTVLSVIEQIIRSIP
jgi:hypothetical protein